MSLPGPLTKMWGEGVAERVILYPFIFLALGLASLISNISQPPRTLKQSARSR